MSDAPEHDQLLDLSAALLEACRHRGLKIATAESCTGGLIAGILTEIPGSSDVVDRGFVTYSDEAKSEMLGVPSDVIEAKGAVSEEVARKMAEGALAHSRADIAVSVTGVAGPGGGTAEKPVGLVHMAVARASGTRHVRIEFGDLTRTDIRQLTVGRALRLLQEEVTK